MKSKFILIAIIFFAAAFRFYGINWDQGYHLHPDERAIIMSVDKLSPPHTIANFFSPTSPWNPIFFAYGSFPFYLLYVFGHILSPLNPDFAHYGLLIIPGRILSSISDLLTIFILFLLGKKLFNERTGLLAAFFYGISVLPIQLSHFYAVDTLLTFFMLTTLYQLLCFYEKPTFKRAFCIGLFFGLALATKVSATVLLIAIGMSLVADFLLLFIKQPHKPHHWFPHLKQLIKHLVTYAVIILIVTGGIFLFFEPYAFIDFKNFWTQTLQQSAMTKDAFTFPYTLQYVHKIPYVYELKNIFLFGLGPILASFAFLGVFYSIAVAIKKDKKNKWAQETILLIFFFAYFLTVGKFAVGFMRYMLPLYPLFCLFAALVFFQLLIFIKQKIDNAIFLKIIYIIIYTLFIIWPVSFIHIYSQNNTRVNATNWILQHIPQGKTLAVEHWDDQLPLVDSQLYTTNILTLYDPDNDIKWQTINAQLKHTDYLIIASNRLYVPLQKLTNCATLPSDRCYTRTAEYYKKLFAGKLGFTKIAEFTSYPTIPLINKKINDQGADESFTVYDHPKVMIFKRTAPIVNL